MDEILTLEQVDAIVVPFMALGHTHVGSDHEIAFAVVSTGDIGIACTSLYAGVLLGIKDGIAAEDVGIVVSVAAHCISSVLSPDSMISYILSYDLYYLCKCSEYF